MLIAKEIIMEGLDSQPTPMSLRTEASERAYQLAKVKGNTKPLADEPSVADYVHWRIIDNRFRPDVAFKTCQMLIPRRVFADFSEMNRTELIELMEILDELSPHFDQVTMNMPHNRSVANHFHLHLNKFYDRRTDMSL